MPSHCYRMRVFDRDLIRGGHYGQRSCEPHRKAEHMAAPTNAAKREKSSCQHGAVHTWHFSDVTAGRRDVRFSNRRVGVKHFQTIHQCGVDVARGLVLLFGIGTGALPSWDSRTRRNNLLVGLAVEERRVQADMRTHLIHRPARDIFPPLGGVRVFSYRV